MSKADVAIVGVACVFPGAPDLGSYWRNLKNGVDAIRDVSPRRWNPVFYDPSSDAADRFYCKRGGLLDSSQRTSRSQDYLARRFLNGPERREFEALPEGRQTEWLNGRIAAKDAVRALHFSRGDGPIFPIEVGISSDDVGRPVVSSPLAGDLSVSIAHKGPLAVALARDGLRPGIDIEIVEPRDDAFATRAFAEAELALLPPTDRDGWLTRFWSAKEAAGKARGTGFDGEPRSLSVREVQEDRFRVDETWVETRVVDGHAIAWTTL